MIKFAHIMPTSYLREIGHLSSCDLVLAHELKANTKYREWFSTNPSKCLYRGQTILVKRIMDNGAFELGQSMEPDQLLDLARDCHATHIVLPDYPGLDPEMTIDSARRWAPIFNQNGFRTLFVPQGRIGNIDDILRCLRYAVRDQYINEIALSIIAIPNAYGVYDKPFHRTLSRWKFLKELPQLDRSIFLELRDIPMHMLGLLDGVQEIALVKQASTCMGYNIQSWDSSAAVWYAHNNESVDDGTPFGRLHGKMSKEVDFNADCNNKSLELARRNIRIIEDLLV